MADYAKLISTSLPYGHRRQAISGQSQFAVGAVFDHIDFKQKIVFGEGSTVPRYFFDIHDHRGCHRDEFGDECENIEDARAQAQSLLPDIAREQLPDGELHTITCDVRDEANRIVYRGEITFRGTRDLG